MRNTDFRYGIRIIGYIPIMKITVSFSERKNLFPVDTYGDSISTNRPNWISSCQRMANNSTTERNREKT